MKKMMNLMCAACLAFTGSAAAMPAPVAVYAEEELPKSGTLKGGQTWKLDDDGTLTVSGTGEMTETYSDYPWVQQKETVQKVVIEKGITVIGNGAFSGMSKLTSVSLPEGVETIGSSAFESCSQLSEITIPESVKKIGDSAFNFCDALKTISFSKNVTSIGRGAIGYCSGLESVTVDADNPYYCAADGVLFTKDKSELLKYPASKTETSYVIPDGVKTIGYVAFRDAVNLAEITFPESVEVFDSFCMNGTKWLSNKQAENPFVVVNGTLVNASKCTGDITVPANVTRIGDRAFYDSGITSVVLPETVTEILKNGLHTGNKLKSVTVMNPDCKYPSYTSFPKDAKLIGLSGSTTEKFATEKNITFEAIGSAPVQTSSETTAVTTTTTATTSAKTTTTATTTAVTTTAPVTVSSTTTTAKTTTVTSATETTVTTTVTQNPTHDIPLGDFDYNGKIEADDAQKVLNVYAEIVAGNDPNLTDMHKEVADVNKDGTVDVIDAQYILIFYVEFTVSGNYSITWEQIIGKKN
ncbi:MAG: leucine-rich repeat protein [Oscillospiraceae bacterium]|nr:leucine-rich repeat protein [Oscillospiraceae bacterium]